MTIRGNTSIVLFLISDLITQFGAGVILTSSNWYVLSMTGSNTMVAAVAAANTISGLVASLFGGGLVDLFGPKRVAFVSHCIRLSLVAIPAVLLARFGFRIEFAILLVLNNGIGWNLYYPASKALIRQLATSRNSVKINSAAEISMQVGLFASGAVAGVLYRYVGFLLILVVSIVMFAVGIAALAAVHVPPIPDEPTAVHGREGLGRSLISGMKEGVRFLVSFPMITIWCIVLYTPFVIGNVNQTLLAGYVQGALAVGSVTFGAIQGLWGVGACIAGFVSALAVRKLSANRLILTGLIILTLFGLVEWLTASVPLTLFVTGIAGFADAVIRIVVYSKLMEALPSRYFGRVLSLMNVVSLVMQTLLSQVAGLMMDAFTPASGYVLIVAVGIGTLVVYGMHPIPSGKLRVDALSGQPDHTGADRVVPS